MIGPHTGAPKTARAACGCTKHEIGRNARIVTIFIRVTSARAMGEDMKTKLFHVYGLNAFDGMIHHWRVKAKNEDDARELFEATEDDSEMEFVILQKKAPMIKEHEHIITAKDIGE